MHSKIRVLSLAGVILAAAALGACSVRPMLATTSNDFGAHEGVQLTSVNVAPVDTRYAQQVRNHLIFLLHGGSAQPASAAYRLDLAITRSVLSTVQIQTGGSQEPTAGTVQMNGSYTLVDTSTGNVVARGSQEATASFDRPLQEYAVLRAERDAEDRAARELAEFIRLSLAQDLVRLGR